MSAVSNTVSKQQVAEKLFERMRQIAPALSHSSKSDLERMGFRNINFNPKIVENTQNWILLLGVPSNLLEVMPLREKSQLEAAQQFFSEHAEELAKTKKIVAQLFNFVQQQ
ncbi:MAG TPA: hypothetical protein VGO47_03660, partial [Chlamydiales bacterium]|nr:hypothetical protein [Chlamydiales bacterium]